MITLGSHLITQDDGSRPICQFSAVPDGVAQFARETLCYLFQILQKNMVFQDKVNEDIQPECVVPAWPSDMQRHGSLDTMLTMYPKHDIKMDADDMPPSASENDEVSQLC